MIGAGFDRIQHGNQPIDIPGTALLTSEAFVCVCDHDCVAVGGGGGGADDGGGEVCDVGV